jgi:hypothetical protein
MENNLPTPYPILVHNVSQLIHNIIEVFCLTLCLLSLFLSLLFYWFHSVGSFMDKLIEFLWIFSVDKSFFVWPLYNLTTYLQVKSRLKAAF